MRCRSSILIAAVLGLFTSACSTPAGGGWQAVVTPARVEAVTKWGAYVWVQGANAAERAAVAQALPGIQVIAAADDVDLVTLAAALRAAGVDYLSTPEGTLAVGAALSFSDLYHDVTGPITRSAYLQAVARGAAEGFALALGTPTGVRAIGSASVVLRLEGLAAAAKAER